MLKHFSTIVFLFSITTVTNAENAKQAYKNIANDLADLKLHIDKTYQRQSSLTYPSKLKITNTKARLLLGADDKSKTIAQATKGSTYKIIDKSSNWYAVVLDKKIKGQSSAWVKASDVVPISKFLTTSNTKSYADKLYEEILEKVNSFKEKYEDNPYVTVSGFSVNIGVPPSVSVSFEFKE